MVLEDHKRKGKKFIPPFTQMMNFTEVHYVERILPEIAWIAFLINHLGPKEGIRVASALISSAYTIHTRRKRLDFALISAFRLLGKKQKSQIIEALAKKRVLTDARNGLAAFFSVYPRKNPLKFLADRTPGKPTEHALAVAKKIIRDNIDRRNFNAVITQSVILYSECLTGKLKFTTNVKPPDLNAIFDDFSSKAAQHAAAHVRMAANQVFMFYEKDIGAEWASYFWNHGLELDEPTHFLTAPNLHAKKEEQHPAHSFAIAYENIVVSLLRETWRALPKDLLESQVAEVIGALLSRQSYMSVKLARNMDFWDWNLGPLILRSMTDCYITLAWILKDPVLRSKQFVSYGLGQEKLMIEYFKEQLKDELGEEDRKSLQAMIDSQESWLNDQHFSFLQEVDVGSWSGLNTRDMAKQCDAMGLYRFAYTPYSTCAHNIWSHIGRFSCRHSDNPLHKFIRTPCFFEMACEPSVFMNSVKYLEKCFTAVVKAFALQIKADMPYGWAADHIGALAKALREYYGEDAEQHAGQVLSETAQSASPDELSV